MFSVCCGTLLRNLSNYLCRNDPTLCEILGRGLEKLLHTCLVQAGIVTDTSMLVAEAAAACMVVPAYLARLFSMYCWGVGYGATRWGACWWRWCCDEEAWYGGCWSMMVGVFSDPVEQPFTLRPAVGCSVPRICSGWCPPALDTGTGSAPDLWGAPAATYGTFTHHHHQWLLVWNWPQVGFSANTLLVGRHGQHLACKSVCNEVQMISIWSSPADATGTQSSLASLKSRIVLPFWYRTHQCRYWWWCKSGVSG